MSRRLRDAQHSSAVSGTPALAVKPHRPSSSTGYRTPTLRKTSLADLLADDVWRAEVEALDAELARLATPNDRLRLRFGEALSKLGVRFRDLGFRRLDLYVRERASRPGRWGADSRRMAERLKRFDRLREAFDAGRVSWSMAELVARYLERAPDDGEAELVSRATQITVRAMREFLGQRLQESTYQRENTGHEPPGPRISTKEEEQEDEERIRLRRLLPAHQAMGLDMTLRVIQHLSGGSTGDAFEWLLAEAHTGMLPHVPPELHRTAEDIEARFRERAKRHMEALSECDRDEAVAEEGIPRPQGHASTSADDDLFGPLPDDAIALDAVIRELGHRIASAEMYRGWTLAQFLALRGWAVLGYASETQYARERLGMSRSDMYRQARLARGCERLPRLRDAVRSGALGSSHAGLLVRVADAKTELLWIERAKQRTVKHLKEEVDAISRVQRYVAGAEKHPGPPTEAEMTFVHAVDREVLTGRALRRAIGIRRPDLDGEPVEVALDAVRPSFRAFCSVFEAATTCGLTPMESPGADSAEESTDVGTGATEASELPIPTSVVSDERTDPPATARATTPHHEPEPKATVPWSESIRPDVLLFFQQLEAIHRATGLPGSFLEFAIRDFLNTWAPHLGKSDVWEHVYRKHRYQCTSPVCDSTNVTCHHIQYRAHGGDDSDENLTTPCEFCHLEGEHGGRLRILPPASRPTYVLGNPTVMVVQGREVVR